MLIVAVIGLGVNLTGMRLLSDGSSDSLNIKAAYLEVLSDMIASLGVIASGVIMLTTKWYRADPLIGAGIGLFILPRTWSLLKQAVHILMEGTPAHIDIEKVELAMKEVEGIKAVHDLHVWTITSGVEALSAHITIERGVPGDSILARLQKILKDQFGIDHTTIQLEEERCEERGVRI
jgi:cobalt-zinc-cadmium efflux system protein